MTVFQRYLAFVFLFCFSGFLQAQWSKTNGLSGGSVWGFDRIGDTVLANMFAGVYYSDDNGQHWSQLPTPGGTRPYYMHVSGNSIGIISSNGRIICSEDSGQSWKSVARADTMLFYEFFIAGPWLYGADYHGLYRTADFGETWEYLRHDQVSTINFDGQRLFARTAKGLEVSNDLGVTWSILYAGSMGYVSKILVQNENIFLFQFSGQKGVRVSQDNGQTWNFYPNTLGFNQPKDVFWHDGKLSILWSFNINISPDFGKTWTSRSLPDYVWGGAAISIDKNLFVGGSEMGVYYSSDDGVTWQRSNQGLNNNGSLLCKTDKGLFSIAAGHLNRLNADGLNWDTIPVSIPIPPNGLNDFVAQGSHRVITDGYSLPKYSTDDGQTWAESTVLDIKGAPFFAWLEPASNKLIAITYNDVFDYFISDDQGQVFKPIKSLKEQFNTQLGTHAFDQGKFYALGSNRHLYRSDDGGGHWSIISTQVPIGATSQAYDIRMFVRGRHIYMFDIYDHPKSQRMFFSNDLGATWTRTHMPSAGLPFGISVFRDLERAGKNLIAATGSGIFLSADHGKTWQSWNEGTSGRPSVWDLEIYDGYVWAAVLGEGIWKRPLSDLGLQADEDAALNKNNGPSWPVSATSVKGQEGQLLLGIYPNPARDRVWFDTGGKPGRLTITDPQGRPMAEANCGSGPLELDVSHLPPGNYPVWFLDDNTRRSAVLSIVR